MLQSASRMLSNLGSRASFNQTLRHMVNVTSIIDMVEKGANLADLLNKMQESEIIQREQINPILYLVLVEKFKVPYVSQNVEKTVTDFARISESFSKWNGVQMVIAYHHPNFGLIPINPANSGHWDIAQELKRDELMVIYSQAKNRREETARKAIEAFHKLLLGEIPQEDPDFIDKSPAVAPTPPPAAAPAEAAKSAAPAAAPAAAPSSTKRSLTPKYSVQVTNELFHNGNVEAWKNIIESFQHTHPTCQVIVYHEGELIHDLNSLFKWGKVKHGGVIFFQIAGTSIKNVSRLQKYLHEGASSRYEAFMKHDLNKKLSLF